MKTAKNQLKISERLALPPDAVTQMISVLGNRGSGKTNTGKVIVEQALALGQQVVIVDPLDVWWGLRSSADGDNAAYPVAVFGGRHQDLPLNPEDGATAADLIVEHSVPAVLSLRHFEFNSQKQKFVTALCNRLWHLKGQEGRNTPLLLVIDEASLFVPQRVGPDDAKMVGAVQRLGRQGRSSGFGLMLIDQRAASVNKDVLTQTELMIAHRHTSPQDRKALLEWVRANDDAGHEAEFTKTLASLDRGEAWVWSPSWLGIFQRERILRSSTFDCSATPKPGEKPVIPRRLADVDLPGLRSKMAKSVEEAKANDPETLKKRIKELERQLATKPPASPPETIIKEVPVLPDEALKSVAAMASSLEVMSRTLEQVRTMIRVPAPTPANSVRPIRPVANPAHANRPPQPARRGSSTAPDGERLGGGERKVLTAIIQFGTVDREQLTVTTGYKRSSRDTYLQRLKSMGLIEQSGDDITATPAGVAAVPDVEPLPTGEELREKWLKELPAGEAAVLRCVLDRYPKPIAREQITDATGYLRSSRDTYLQRLSSRKLVESVGRGEVRASRNLFE